MQKIYLTTRRGLTHAVEAVKGVFNFKHLQSLVALWHLRNSKTVCNYYLLAIACIATCFCSCTKESLSDDAMVNSTSISTASASAKRSGSPNSVNYGALIGSPTTGPGWLSFQQNIAAQLGVSCLRGATPVPGNGNQPVLLTSGYDVLLNFNNGNDYGDDGGDDNGDDGGDNGNGNGNGNNNGNGNSNGNNGHTPIPFVSDLVQYKIDLNNIISLCTVKPVVAVIENEEANRLYYSGSAADYIKELKVAIDVMHANGIKVANGGLGGGFTYLVYENLIAQGKDDEADLFKQITHVTPNNPNTQVKGAYVDSLLHAYSQMDVDYVNFHWKCSSPDAAQALNDAINYLKKRCNKPVISNELGQFDEDPNTLQSMLQTCTDQNLPYVVWYSPDEHAGKKDTPLQHGDGTLTPTGNAYQGFLAN